MVCNLKTEEKEEAIYEMFQEINMCPDVINKF